MPNNRFLSLVPANVQMATFPIIHHYNENNLNYLATIGTGFFINRKGYFITCSHVMQHRGEKSMFLSFGNIPQPPRKARLIKEIYRDQHRDICLGHIDCGATPFVEISHEITKMEDVVFYGYGDAGHPTRHNGGLASLENVHKQFVETKILQREDRSKSTFNYDRFYTFRGINSGMSGSPCINSAGCVIGMATSTRENVEKAGDFISVFTPAYEIDDVFKLAGN